MRTTFLSLCLSALATAAVAQPANTNAFTATAPTAELANNMMMEHLLSQQIATGSADYAAACISVTQAVKRKALLIFAVTPTAKTGVFKEGDWEVQVVFSQDIYKHDSKAGAFYQHSNGGVLSYAAWQYSSGNRDLALRLIRRLAEAQPGLNWSSPSHPPTTIQQILSGLENADGSMTQYLKEDSEWWLSRAKEFGQ